MYKILYFKFIRVGNNYSFCLVNVLPVSCFISWVVKILKRETRSKQTAPQSNYFQCFHQSHAIFRILFCSKRRPDFSSEDRFLHRLRMSRLTSSTPKLASPVKRFTPVIREHTRYNNFFLITVIHCTWVKLDLDYADMSIPGSFDNLF